MALASQLLGSTSDRPPAHAAGRIWLPSGFVIFSLLALLLMPLLLERRIQRLRDEVAEVVEPARTTLGHVELAFAREAAAVRSFLLSRDPRFLELYRTVLADERARLERLNALSTGLGEPYGVLAKALRDYAERWHREQLAVLEGSTSPDEYLAPGDLSHERMLRPAMQLDAQLVALGRARRNEVQRLDRLGLLLSGILVALAGAAAIVVAWSGQRFRRRAREEQALRDAALTLTEAVATGEVLRRIVAAAVAVDRGSSAYVERLSADAAEVEVVATTGQPAPPQGARAPHPGSLTAAAIESGTSEVVLAVTRDDRPMMRRFCVPDERCSALAVPLVADATPLGALVVLRGPERRAYRERDLTQARIFGTLAALALRKAVLLEQAEERHHALQTATENRVRLLRGFSHDVKNPLGAADGYAALLESGVVHDEAERLQSAARIRRSIRTALDLINDLVELARAEAGQLEIRTRPVDISALAAATADDFRGAAEAAGLTLETRIAPDLPVIESDDARVRQVLGNLLTNAIKYTPTEGHIAVDAALQHGRRGSDPTDWVSLAVSDSGPGIPEDQRRLIFQEFTRVGTGDAPGVGLGLAISQRVAQLLGGDISVASKVGEGSTFALWLPAHPPHPKSGDRPASHSAPQRRRANRDLHVGGPRFATDHEWSRHSPS